MSNSEIYTESWLLGPQSTNFYTRTYLPPAQQKSQAAVIFIHGFAEHIGRYTHFHPVLAAHGIAVFTYDQRGYGLTAQDTTGNKSKGSAYGKSSWKEQMEDIAWAIEHARTTFDGVPLFLMGHSMGGGEVLGFACQGPNGEHTATLKSLSGVISSSPIVQQTHPAPKMKRAIGGLLSIFLPGVLIPAEVKAEDLSHDPAVFDAYKSDPLVKMMGSLKGLHDMLSKGEWLLNTGYIHWPKDIPVFIVHGTEDQVTNFKASQGFHDKLPQGAEKRISLFDGGYHELHNEPNGVKEKLADMIIDYVQEHISAPNKMSAGTSAPASEPAADTVADGLAEGVAAKAKM